IAYIWAFYVNRPIKYELLEAPWASVVEELKKLGCIRIVMQTSRRAWERQAQKFGFHQTMLTYERDI
ncbi:MAG: hypothetical protein ACREVA_13000, partial [Burkholderiales bacterium]